MVRKIKEEDTVVWQCEVRTQLLSKIGKQLDELTEDEWDILLAHSRGCKICQLNHQVAKVIIEEGLPEVLAELELEKKLEL